MDQHKFLICSHKFQNVNITKDGLTLRAVVDSFLSFHSKIVTPSGQGNLLDLKQSPKPRQNTGLDTINYKSYLEL